MSDTYNEYDNNDDIDDNIDIDQKLDIYNIDDKIWEMYLFLIDMRKSSPILCNTGVMQNLDYVKFRNWILGENNLFDE